MEAGMTTVADLQVLEKILARMLADNKAITARSVVRASDSPFKHASDITRQPTRRELLEKYQSKQHELRALIEKTDSRSRTNLQLKVARLAQENETLMAQRTLLIASHKAMLLAVGELGGMAAWQRLFPKWDAIQEQLKELDALPKAGVASLHLDK